MTTTDSNEIDPIEKLVTDYLLYLDGEGERPDLAHIPQGDRAEAAARLHLLDGLRTASVEAPAGAADRTARTLGFDRVGGRIAVSGPQLKRARDAKGMSLKDIAEAATAAGAPTRTADLLRAESATSTPLDQELVTVLVAILNTSVDAIEDDLAEDMTATRTFLDGPRFESMIADWSSEHDWELEQTRTIVRDRALATQYRAKDITEDQIADLIRAILRSLE